MGDTTTVVRKYASSAVASPPRGFADLVALQDTVNQLATTVATLSKTIRCGDGGGRGSDKRKPKIGRGDGGAGDDTDKNSVHLWDQKYPPKGTLKHPHCHLFVYYKPERCFKIEASKVNHPKTWSSNKGG